MGRAAGGEQGERAPQGRRPLQGRRRSGAAPPAGTPAPAPPPRPGWRGPRERRPLGAGPGKRTPTPPGPRVPGPAAPGPRRAGTLLAALRRAPASLRSVAMASVFGKPRAGGGPQRRAPRGQQPSWGAAGRASPVSGVRAEGKGLGGDGGRGAVGRKRSSRGVQNLTLPLSSGLSGAQVSWLRHRDFLLCLSFSVAWLPLALFSPPPCLQLSWVLACLSLCVSPLTVPPPCL